MNPLGNPVRIGFLTASHASESDDDLPLDIDFELSTVRIEDEEEVAPTSHIPLPPPGITVPRAPATPASLQTDLNTELCHWSTKYSNDTAFKKKIDQYVEFRAQVMELKGQGVSSENPDEDPLEPLYQKLGTMLAEAFGMVDPETKDWTQEVKDAASKGGAEYARPSVKSFMWTQLPTIAKSTINLYTRIFCGEQTASTVKRVMNFAYPFVQAPISIWAAQNNGYEQSEAVQLQKRENPEWSPNVESSKILNEDGTLGELRAMRHVLEDLGQLREVDALIKERNPIKLEQKRSHLVGQTLRARATLLEQLTHVTKALGKSQESGTSPPLNDIEKKILNEDLTLEQRIAELSRVTTGRAALPGLARLEAKRLLRQLAGWNMLHEELDTAIESVKAGAPYESIRVRKAVVDTDFERAKVTRYVMLNVLSHQAIVRDIRTAFYAGATVTQVSLQLAEYLTGYEGTVAGDAMQVITSLVQTLYYVWKYPDATGKDALNKFATQWQIIAMTGTGNLIGKDGEFDAAKLDKMVTGKLNTRLGAFGSLLGSDQTVYGQAVLGWLVDPRTVDDDEAEKVEVGGKKIPCTYAALADRFGKLKPPAERTAFIDAIAAQRPLAPGVKEKIDRNLQLYEENAANVENKGDASKLLGDDSTLPPTSQDVLRGSLEQVADSGNATSGNDKLDRELFKRAGKVEQLGELPSQASQKLGQAFAWFVAGTSGFLVLKSIFSLGVQALISAGELTEGGAEELAGWILGGKIAGNTVALAGLVFQLGFNHGYQDYIARKALLRQNAGGGVSIVNAPPPSLRGSLLQEFMVSVGFEDARVEEITGYETLVGKPIPKEDWPPKLKFLRRAKLTEAMWDQMFAVDVKSSWVKNFFEEHGTLEGKTGEELEEAIRENLAAIKKLRADSDGTGSSSDDVVIEVLEPRPKIAIPILNLNPVEGGGNAGPPSEDEQRKPLSPRSFRAKRIDELKTTAARKEGILAKPRPDWGRTGESRIERHIVRDPDHLARIDDDDQREDDARIDFVGGLSNQETRIKKPSKLMKELPWEKSRLGPYVARTENGFYLSPDPNMHASPIQAFSIPDENGEGLVHLSDREHPSLAVSSMLQLDLGRNKNWSTLATDGEFARFFHQHLHNQPQPELRLAEMRMQDLATFTQQMALENPEAHWYPMTTTTVRYIPDADPPIRSDKAPPPALRAGQSFGLSYDSPDFLGNPVQSSVLLSYDQRTGFYSIIAPTSREPIATKAREPMGALQDFMEMLGTARHNLQDTSFTVLYHVPPEHHGEDNKEVRQRVNDEEGDAEALAWTWIAHHDGNAFKAKGDIEQACKMLEEENSYLLWDAYFEGWPTEKIARSVAANRKAIERLGGAYAHLVAGLDRLAI
ncbi:hypothetical protein H6CHR_01838 [Variovorax sp. PBL-H6]|uniref:hypothetical protein n=1 Tax=Variovorax sp. PBL-H6 TaxID=434009 RepID=UPI0013163544|nr:hypothetical protein [Variovorax sp. PBL-H6]VTU22692.1 hypothetical protein H6CHR_01838 [Variovorax sp. PBL-H6]